jgi:hypothetical protein
MGIQHLQNRNTLADFSSLLAKPKVFVSYHHGPDQGYKDRFSQLFSSHYNIITDRSLDDPFKSSDNEYIRRQIRERHLTGTSLTIVLCGPQSPKRKWIDWEIMMTLGKQHGLLGIRLPTIKSKMAEILSPPPKTLLDSLLYQEILPPRLKDNLNTGYAHEISWTEDWATLRTAIEIARENSGYASLISNSREPMKNNRP